MKEFDIRYFQGECTRFKEERTIPIFGQKLHPMGCNWPMFVPTENRCEDKETLECCKKCSIYQVAHVRW